MKKGTRLWGLFALFLLVFCSSCKDDETNDDPLCTLKVQAQRNEISGDGGDVVFDVTSNGAWSYTIDQQEQWLTEKSKSAERLTLTAAVGSDAERKATVTFTSEADSKLKETITITQHPREALPQPLVPEADLLDVVFRNDGTAEDISRSGIPVETLSGMAMMTYYNDAYRRFVSHFHHTPGTTVNEGFYKADYAADQQFINGLADGHSLEVLFKTDVKSDGSAEWKMFSAMSSGGTGFLISKADKGTELTFLPNVSTTGKSNWIWTKSGINPEAGRYYHVVGVWNKQEEKSYIYVDGELKGTMPAPGNFVHPSKTTSYWFGVGVDASPASGQNAWKGDVAIARVYDAPLTAENVEVLWNLVKRQQRPDPIEISDLLFLSGCEVGAGYRYTIYGKGFAAGDKIRFEPVDNAKAEAMIFDASVTAESATIVIPDTFVTDRYRMFLLRGAAEYPLGFTQLTFTDNPLILAKPRAIAHRGYHTAGAPENSVAALAAAQALEIYGSEFDVWVTADGRIVINHDKTFPGDSHVIENSTYDQLKNIKLSNGENIPTLEDYLTQAAKSDKTKLICEIKRHSSAANNQRAADAVVAAVKAAGLTDRVEYIAFDLATCKRIAAALPDAMVQYLNGDIAPAALRADGIRGIDYTFSTISVRPDWIREAHDNGMVVNTWTVNAEQDMMSCIALGMDFITTNYPQTLKELLTKTFVAPN